MALSPNDVALTTEELEMVRELEAVIDEELRYAPVLPERVLKIIRPRLLTLQFRVVHEVIRRYKSVGWTDCQFGEETVTLILQREV